MINKKCIVLMKKKKKIIVNTARRELVVDTEKSFYYPCNLMICNESTFKAGDVKSVLTMHPKVFATHHIGASTQQVKEAIGVEAVRMGNKYIAESILNKENLKVAINDLIFILAFVCLHLLLYLNAFVHLYAVWFHPFYLPLVYN